MILGLALSALSSFGKNIYVSSDAKSYGDGTIENPYKKISYAASVALAGDTILIHGGVYREWVSPANSGKGYLQPVVYMSVPGEDVYLKGSEEIKNWEKEKNGIWKVEIPNSFFADYNPYDINLFGDWLHNGKELHLGEVYINGVALVENIENELNQENTWTSEVNADFTTIKANFGKINPNKNLVEINVRPACFLPKTTGINYITVSGLKISQAASQWAAPTNEQLGAIGPNWSKGWVIENCEVYQSKCVGISLGKSRASGHNLWSLYSKKTCMNKHGFSREIEAILKAVQIGWNKENIGSHVVRNNVIHDCGQAGIVGHLGGAFCHIYGNEIYRINMTEGRITGFETAGIKLHAAIDTKIEHNYIHDNSMGLWLDWQAQGTHVANNLFDKNEQQDLFIEVSHGPTLVYNNILLSPLNVHCVAQGIAFFNNMFVGKLTSSSSAHRYTPYHEAHSTMVKGLYNNTGGDIRFYNNIFFKNPVDHKNGENGLKAFDNNPVWTDSLFVSGSLPDLLKARLPMISRNNVYCNGTKSYKGEVSSYFYNEIEDIPLLQIKEDGVYLNIPIDYAKIKELNSSLVNTSVMGMTIISEASFEKPDATRFVLSEDILKNQRNIDKVVIGPFERFSGLMKVWNKNNKSSR